MSHVNVHAAHQHVKMRRALDQYSWTNALEP
jgi:hypothetical protein